MPSQFANAFAALVGKNTSAINAKYGSQIGYGQNIQPINKTIVNTRRKSINANMKQLLARGLTHEIIEKMSPPGSPMASNVRRSRRARKNRKTRKSQRRATARRSRK